MAALHFSTSTKAREDRAIYRALGIESGTQVRDAIGRPFPIAGSGGRPIAPLF